MTISIHENSIKKIKLLIKKIIDNPKLNEANTYYYPCSEFFDLIADELNQRKIEFKIDRLKCYVIFITVLNETFKEKDIEEHTELNRFIDSVFDVYQNTPLDWCVRFHFKRLNLSRNINDFDLINLSHDKYQTFESMLRYNTYKEYSVVEIHMTGFFSYLNSDKFIKQTTQHLNILILLLRSYEVLAQDSKKFKSDSLVSILSGIDDGAVIISVANILYPSLFSRETSLPDSMQSHYGRFIVKNNNESDINKALIIANSLASNNSKESLRIKSAIDWLVSSDIMEDSTMSFIQVCIGLESIFGDDDYEGGLTNILSDRCAYLIGKNINDRKIIKKTFKDIYQIRSKIIHGVRNHLSEKEERLKNVARMYLNKSIMREIDNLELTSST